MLKGKLLVLGAATLGLVAYAQSAMAATAIVITPGVAENKTLEYEQAAPSRYFSVEKAVTLPQGSNRFGANLGVGTSGNNALAGGVNLRADLGVSPGLETGIAVSGLGASGSTSNLLGHIGLDGKLALGKFGVGSVPVRVAGLANLGAFASGGGIGSAAVGIGLPLSAALGDRLNVSVVPGLDYGFAGGNTGTTAMVANTGVSPSLGLGADLMLTDCLSGLVDGRVGGIQGTVGDVGLRYGFSDNLAADLFLGYQGNPITNLNTGTIGVGGYYAF